MQATWSPSLNVKILQFLTLIKCKSQKAPRKHTEIGVYSVSVFIDNLFIKNDAFRVCGGWPGCVQSVDSSVCFQLEEIRNIGSLPCLEKLNLSSNPMCIIPDYRTKVLAQFGDRATEVHNIATLLPLLQHFPLCDLVFIHS